MSDPHSEETRKVLERVEMLAPVERAVWSHVGNMVEYSTTDDAHTVVEWVIHELLGHGFTILTPAGSALTSFFAEPTDD